MTIKPNKVNSQLKFQLVSGVLVCLGYLSSSNSHSLLPWCPKLDHYSLASEHTLHTYLKPKATNFYFPHNIQCLSPLAFWNSSMVCALRGRQLGVHRGENSNLLGAIMLKSHQHIEWWMVVCFFPIYQASGSFKWFRWKHLFENCVNNFSVHLSFFHTFLRWSSVPCCWPYANEIIGCHSTGELSSLVSSIWWFQLYNPLSTWRTD